MLGARWATALSAALATPPLLLLVFARLDYEPPFVPLLTDSDGTPTTLGRAFMLGVLLSVPIGLLINLLPRFAAATWDGSSQGRAVVSANVIVGAVLILLMIMLLSAFALEATACSVGVPNCD